MKALRRAAILLMLTAAFVAGVAQAQASRPAPLPGLVEAGQGGLSYLGLSIYRARLWVSPGFTPERYAAQALALELHYQRGFSAQAIAKRSIQEMRRVGRFTPEQATRWQQALAAALPDVKADDRVIGLHQPGQGVVFLLNGQRFGEVADPDLAPLFFGIWLSPQTSEPALRQALLATTPAVAATRP